MSDLELQVQKGWIELARDMIIGMQTIHIQKQTADQQWTVLLDLQKDEFQKRYQGYMDQLLTNHINIEHINSTF